MTDWCETSGKPMGFKWNGAPNVLCPGCGRLISLATCTGIPRHRRVAPSIEEKRARSREHKRKHYVPQGLRKWIRVPHGPPEGPNGAIGAPPSPDQGSGVVR
jgi:hypothetical protein